MSEIEPNILKTKVKIVPVGGFQVRWFLIN